MAAVDAGEDTGRHCSICRDDRDDGSEVTALMCGCVFHKSCVDSYCHHAGKTPQNMRCPQCRQDVASMLAAEDEFRGPTPSLKRPTELQQLGIDNDSDPTTQLSKPY